jgi:hypothetical protein
MPEMNIKQIKEKKKLADKKAEENRKELKRENGTLEP